jgi:hypothetical protein
MDRVYPELVAELGARSNRERIEAIMAAGNAIGWPRRIFFLVAIPLVFIVPGALTLIAATLIHHHPVLSLWQWPITYALGFFLALLALGAVGGLYQVCFREMVRRNLSHTWKSGCPDCDHDLRGLIHDKVERVRCPECGGEFDRHDLRFVCSLAPAPPPLARERKRLWRETVDTGAVRWLGVLLLVLGYGQWMTTALLVGPTLFALVLLFMVSAAGIRLAFAGRDTWRRRWIDTINSGCVLLLPAAVGGYPPAITAYGLGSWAMLWGAIAVAGGCAGLTAQALMSEEAKERLVRMWYPTHRPRR